MGQTKHKITPEQLFAGRDTYFVNKSNPVIEICVCVCVCLCVCVLKTSAGAAPTFPAPSSASLRRDFEQKNCPDR